MLSLIHIFCRTAAQQGDNVLLHGSLGKIAPVVLRQRHGIAACHSPGNDGDLVYRVLCGTVIGADSVTSLVIGSQTLFLLGYHLGALFGAGDHLDGGVLDLLHGNGTLIGTGSQQSRLVYNIFQIRAGEADRGLCHSLEVDIRAHGLIAHMHLENLLTTLDIGIAYQDLTVEPARTQQRRVQNILAVGGGNDDDARIGAETVHLNQQLVEGLFPLVMTAAQTLSLIHI